MPAGRTGNSPRRLRKRIDIVWREVEQANETVQIEDEQEIKTLEDWLAAVRKAYDLKHVSEENRHKWLVGMRRNR